MLHATARWKARLKFHDRCKNLDSIFSGVDLERKKLFEVTADKIHPYFYLSCIKI
jgi:hypothetical protein